MLLPSSTVESPLAASVRRRFSRSAFLYDIEARVQAVVAARTAEYLPQGAESVSRILEVGCGTGFLTKHLVERYPTSTITACDLSGPMLSLAHRTVGNSNRVSFVEGDFLRLPFDSRFDLVTSSSTFQWIHPLAVLFERIRTRLESGGLCVFSAFTDDTFRELRELRHALFPTKKLHHVLPAKNAFIDELARAKFTISSLAEEDFPFSAPNTEELLRQVSALGFSANSHESHKTCLSRGELLELCGEYDKIHTVLGRGVQAKFRACFIVSRAP